MNAASRAEPIHIACCCDLVGLGKPDFRNQLIRRIQCDIEVPPFRLPTRPLSESAQCVR